MQQTKGDRRRMRLCASAAVLMLGACTMENAGDPSAYRGRVLPQPYPKTDFTLTTMDGEPFSFREETEGYVTLLFFGYTHCPDVCPLHMANIGAVLEKMSPDVANEIKVVFVTTDPERDTPERLREWLGGFHRKFVGLRGSLERVNEIQQAIGLAPAFREDLPDGGYGIGHSAQVLAYTTDNLAHVTYPFGTRQVDWAHDLPKLVRDGPPGG